MNTLIIIPAYNEGNNIEAVIEDIFIHCRNDHDILVVNDCSLDNTAEILEKKPVKYLNLAVNLGIGGAVQSGYLYALRNGYDIAVQFDGDGQHDARYIEALIKPIENDQADVVIGSRFVEGKGFQSSTARRTGINILGKVIKLLSGVTVKDVTSGMRAVNREMLEFYAKNYAQDFPEPEAILTAGLNNMRIIEIPVIMKERISGKSSISSFTSVYYMVKVSLALFLSRISTEKKRNDQ